MTDSCLRSIDSVLSTFAVEAETSMRQVLAVIDANGEGVALVLDPDRRLLGIVTDGDIRRAILAEANFEAPVSEFLGRKTGVATGPALTAPADMSEPDLVRLMNVRLVRHLPLVEETGRVAGLALLSELAKESHLPIQAVVMAGGFGQRLRPLTEDLPKPLLPVGDKPVIERIVGQLRDSGIRRVNVTTHYHADKIEDHLGDGDAYGIEVAYTHETEPRGTAGALSALRGGDEPLLVVNGDILTAVDFRAMLNFHREHGSDITVGVRKYEVAVPFGVFDVNGARVEGLREKPTYSLFINAGIYLLEPAVLDLIPETDRTDMTDLIQKIIDRDGVVTSFPIHEYWLDIGQLQDYMRAQADAAAGKFDG
jgi:dTDP-glucose pyrophosphorylase/CBS domain-containing protein